MIPAGANRKPGQSRTDLARDNLGIYKKLIPDILKYITEAILLVVTNSVDILAYCTLKISGLPSGCVIGSGAVLDTARLRYMLSDHCKVDQ